MTLFGRFLARARSLAIAALALFAVDTIAYPVLTTELAAAAQKGRKKSSVSRQRAKKGKESSSRARGKRSRRVREAPNRVAKLTPHDGDDRLSSVLLSYSAVDTTLADGVRYFHVLSEEHKFSAHVVRVDTRTAGHLLKPIKAYQRNTSLERLSSMTSRWDSLGLGTILAAVNANFWGGYSSTPIGHTAIDGVVLTMNEYKQWSSAFIERNGALTIDRFVVSAAVEFPRKRRTFPIAATNRRSQEQGIVLYTPYADSVIPAVTRISTEELQRELEANAPPADIDSTEEMIMRENVVEELKARKREGSIEFSRIKAVVEFIDPPAINRKQRVKVVKIDTGSVALSPGRFIISFGSDTDPGEMPWLGDTLRIHFGTNVHSNKVFHHAVAGVPRLVRQGKAAHEARAEGATSRRFISQRLPRTALGSSKSGSVVYLVCVDPGSYGRGTMGMTLAEMASLMRAIGAWNALNLDGGGSTGMVVGGRNVVRTGAPERERRISVAFGVVVQPEADTHHRR